MEQKPHFYERSTAWMAHFLTSYVIMWFSAHRSGNSRCGFAAASYEIFVKFFVELFAK